MEYEKEIKDTLQSLVGKTRSKPFTQGQVEYILGLMSHGDLSADPYERNNQAQTHLERAVELGFPCHFELGLTYERRGNMEKAAQEYLKIPKGTLNKIRAVRRIAKYNTDVAFQKEDDLHAIQCMRELADLLESSVNASIP